MQWQRRFSEYKGSDCIQVKEKHAEYEGEASAVYDNSVNMIDSEEYVGSGELDPLEQEEWLGYRADMEKTVLANKDCFSPELVANAPKVLNNIEAELAKLRE